MKHYTLQGWEEHPEGCIVEATVSLNVNGKAWVTMQCLPENLEALAVGFLFNEGVIQLREEICLVQVCPDGSLVDIWLNHAVERPTDWRITSGCGGGQSAASMKANLLHPALPRSSPLFPADILQITDDFLSQTQRNRIRGTHTSAWYKDQGSVISVDIGRHNTLDKLAGQFVLDGHSPAGGVLITTGRISADMLQKAARMGTPWIISLRSATSLALRLAEAWNITLIAHANRGGFDLLYDQGRLSA